MRRRTFLKDVGLRTAGFGLGLSFLRRGLGAAPPSDRIVMAHIGVGGMGNSHVNWFSGFNDVEIAALCDVDEGHREQTRARLRKRRPAAAPDLYEDFRAVLLLRTGAHL